LPWEIKLLSKKYSAIKEISKSLTNSLSKKNNEMVIRVLIKRIQQCEEDPNFEAIIKAIVNQYDEDTIISGMINSNEIILCKDIETNEGTISIYANPEQLFAIPEFQKIATQYIKTIQKKTSR